LAASNRSNKGRTNTRQRAEERFSKLGEQLGSVIPMRPTAEPTPPSAEPTRPAQDSVVETRATSGSAPETVVPPAAEPPAAAQEASSPEVEPSAAAPPEGLIPPAAPTSGLTTLPLSAIRVAPDFNVRDRAEDPELDELADSIAAFGLLEPLLVTPDPDTAPPVYQVLAGHRRLAALHLNGATEALVHIKVVADEDEALAVSMAENVHRRQLTWLEEARGYQRLADKGWAVRRIAKHMRRAPAHVSVVLQIQRLPRIWELVEQGQISPSVARALTQLFDENGQPLREDVLEDTLAWVLRHHPSYERLKHYISARLASPSATNRNRGRDLPQRIERQAAWLERRATQLPYLYLVSTIDRVSKTLEALETERRLRELQTDPARNTPDGEV
jgi:ParB family chromosome partitioning protein